MTMVNRWTNVHVLVVIDDTTFGGWIRPTTVKILPATIADIPAWRMRFAAVIFIFLFLSFVWDRLKNLLDRDQGQTQIAHLVQQAMQRGLVDHRTANDGCAIALL